MPRRRPTPDHECLTARLVEVGADPQVVRNVLTIIREPPLLWLFIPDLVEPSKTLSERWTLLYRLSQHPRFIEYSSALQDAVLRELETLWPQWVEAHRRWEDAIRGALAGNAMMGPWLDIHTAHQVPRGRGQPSHPDANLFMALMTAHLKARCGRYHYAVVGEVAQALFPGCLDGEAQLGEAVRARARRFRRQHQVPQLLAELTRLRLRDAGDEPVND